MASRSIQPAAAAKKSILTPVLTLEGHKDHVPSISYFPDGKQIISGSSDKTVRQWDLQAGKEIEEARHFCEQDVRVVAVSRDGQWVVTAGGDDDHGELKAYEVETGIVKTFQGHSKGITCIDISMDSTLLAGGSSHNHGVRIWSLDTGKLVAGPFKSDFILATTGAVRFSQDSKKLAVANSIVAKCLEVWDVEAQELDVSVGKSHSGGVTFAPIFWTTKDKTIVAAFSFTDDSDAKTIYEFDASTLETVGPPFEGHKTTITGLALSFDCALLASVSNDNTIKLWAFESRQLLASFHGQNPNRIIYGQSPNRVVLSPDSRQLAYTTYTGNKIHICDIPPEILASICAQKANTSTPKDPRLANLLNSDATRRAVRRNPAMSSVRRPGPRPQRQLPSVDPHQSAFLRYLRKLHSSESRMNAVPPVLNNQPRDLLDFPATSALPSNRFFSARPSTRGHSHKDPRENSRPTPAPPTILSSGSASSAGLHGIFTWWPVRAGHSRPPIIDVPLAWGDLRHAAAGAPSHIDDDLIRDEDYVPDPNSQTSSAGAQIDAGVHGKGLLCGCF